MMRRMTAATRPDGLRLVCSDESDSPELDRAVWVPHYLPAVFDFPARSVGDADAVPELVVDHVRGYERIDRDDPPDDPPDGPPPAAPPGPGR